MYSNVNKQAGLISDCYVSDAPRFMLQGCFGFFPLELALYYILISNGSSWLVQTSTLDPSDSLATAFHVHRSITSASKKKNVISSELKAKWENKKSF